MKAPWLKNLLMPAVHRVTTIAKRISRSASFSRPSSSVMLAALSHYAVDSPRPRLLCARANPSADRDPVATFMAHYLDVDRLAEVSEAVWSSVGAPAARATILHHAAGARPSTKVRKIPDTTNEY